MASQVSGIIERIWSDNTTHAIASTAYGVCSTNADQAAKTVEMTGFKLIPGVTIHVKFTHENTATSPPTLNVESTGAIPIVEYSGSPAGTSNETTGWQEGAIVSLTYDGTSWVKNQGYNTDTTYSAFSGSGIGHSGGLVPDPGSTSGDSKFLCEDGSWQVPDYPTLADLGLSTAMHFIGITSTELTDGATTSSLTPKTAGSLSKTTNFEAGDVVIYDDEDAEFVWTGSAWAELGSGSGSGAAGVLSIPREIYVDLTTTRDSNNPVTFDGSADISIDVDGILPIGHGGTGTDDPPTAGGVIYGKTDNNNTIYDSTTAGTAGQVLISGGSSAPSWYEGLILNTTSGVNNAPDTYDATFSGTIAASNVFIGNDDDYGDAYQPVYWNNGVPSITSPVQYFTWSITQDNYGVQLSNSAFTEDTFPLMITIYNGESYLNGPLTWENGDGTFKIKSSAQVSGTVSGYCVVARGTTLNVTSTAISSLT